MSKKIHKSEDKLQGDWEGSYTAMASYGTFTGKAKIQFSNTNFEIVYYDGQTIRSGAKGTFKTKDGFVLLCGTQKKETGKAWNNARSDFKFAFEIKNEDLFLEATDHRGINSKIKAHKKKK